MTIHISLILVVTILLYGHISEAQETQVSIWGIGVESEQSDQTIHKAQPHSPVKTISLSEAIIVTRQYLRAQEKLDMEAMYNLMTGAAQDKMHGLKTAESVVKFLRIPENYLHSEVKCAICYREQTGKKCQVLILNVNRRVRGIYRRPVLLTLSPDNITGNYTPKISDISHKTKTHKMFKKREPVCEGL